MERLRRKKDHKHANRVVNFSILLFCHFKKQFQQKLYKCVLKRVLKGWSKSHFPAQLLSKSQFPVQFLPQILFLVLQIPMHLKRGQNEKNKK